MFSRRILILAVCIFSVLDAFSQRIVYSEPDNDDTRRMNFEVIGKVDGNFLVYKNTRGRHYISVLNNEMEQVAKVEQEYVPDNDRVINVDFFPYNDFFYMIYQYQKRNIVHCIAAKIDANGKQIGDVTELDTTQIGFAASNKIYTVLSSEDKSRIIVFKINSRNRRQYKIATALFDDQLHELKRSRLAIDMEERNDYLGEFNLDNSGDLVFTKYYRTNADNISDGFFIIKYAQADSFSWHRLNVEKNNLDEIRIKVDNANQRYFLTSFYYKERRGNIEGLYYYVWDKPSQGPVLENTIVFSDELRKEAKGDANSKMAFNDYFIKNIITRKDGGFLISSEAFYTTSRFNAWNRYDYLYRYSYMSPMDYYYYYPYYNSAWGNSRWGSQNVRYHADNVAILSFDKDGKMEWNDVIVKSQFDDDSDEQLSYLLMISGGQLHFLFNQLEKRTQLLNDYSAAPDGKMTRNPTLKNLDRGYTFMPKFGKQVSAKQAIIPCLYKNYICFAKVDYN